LRALLEKKSIGNPIWGIWASIHEAYVAVVTATTLLLKLDAQVHDWASKGTSLEGRACLASWLFSLLRCKMSLILPKCLYGITAEFNTWEGRENLKNAKEAIEEFEKEYRQNMENVERGKREFSCD